LGFRELAEMNTPPLSAPRCIRLPTKLSLGGGPPENHPPETPSLFLQTPFFRPLDSSALLALTFRFRAAVAPSGFFWRPFLLGRPKPGDPPRVELSSRRSPNSSPAAWSTPVSTPFWSGLDLRRFLTLSPRWRSKSLGKTLRIDALPFLQGASSTYC